MKKGLPAEELLHEVRRCAAGEIPMTAGMLEAIIGNFRQCPSSQYELTIPEIEILEHARSGHTYAKTAAATGLTVDEVHDMVGKIYEKLSMFQREEADRIEARQENGSLAAAKK